MGQNNSAQLQTRSTPNSPRGQSQKSPPPPRPSAPPQIPKIPNYAVPENRVIPIGATTDLPNKRQLLRPVSQELTKFHPDFADIFQYQDEGLDREGPEDSLGGEKGRDVVEVEGMRGGEGKENLTSSRGGGMSSRSGGGSGGIENGSVGSSRFSTPIPNDKRNQKPNNIELSRSQSVQEPITNGHVINGYVSTNPNGSDVTERGRPGVGVHRTNSLDRSSSGPMKMRGHKRFPSASTSLANEASVIPEDPREHLYTHWRQDPYTNPTPTITSLPLKNSFDLDYKESLTYAQLAEHRRQKRNADLEEKTGQKMADLTADLKQQNTVPVSPFDRANFTPSLPSAGSTTGSSDTGVSKSKKRRAPPPPSSAGQHRDSSPGRLSLDVEPPADYDLDDPSPPLDSQSPWKPNLSRKSSNASMLSKNSKGPAPKVPPAPPAPPPPPPPPAPPVTKTPAKTDVKLPSKNPLQMSSESARLIAQAKAEIEALKKLEMILKEEPSTKATTEVNSNNIDVTTEDERNENPETEGEDLKGDDNESKRVEDDADVTKEIYEIEVNRDLSLKESDMDTSKAETEDSTPKTESGSSSPRRLSSLLQHDIMLAAKARSAKGQVKAKTPVQHVKPKDPAELFREELAKAATAREERAKSVDVDKENTDKDVPNGDAVDRALVFQSDMVKVKRRPAVSEDEKVTTEVNKQSPPPVFPKPESPKVESPPVTKLFITKSEPDLLSAQDDKASQMAMSRQRPPEGYTDDTSNLRKAVSHNGILDLSDDDEVVPMQTSSSSQQFTQDWKPEDDLDTDDEMMDDMTYSRSSAVLEASDGFKTSVIPSKVDDLKAAKRKSSKSGRRESGSSTDEKNKFGSIRKFQKSVHKSVRNAFGSISKASGKLLRKNKSHDFDQEEIEGMKYRVTDEDDSTPDHQYTNGHLSEKDTDDDGDDDDVDTNYRQSCVNGDQPVRVMKRAGVAYVGRKGQIVVLPEYETVKLDEDGSVIGDKDDGGRAPRIFKKKKKKFTYESTVRRQEKDRMADQYLEEIREKERQIEYERRKQQEMEREFQRLRDMETQEKLQRIQTAQLQQQMNLLHQQQQQLTGLQFAPTSTLPPHNHQRYSMPEFSGQGLYTSAAGLSGVGPQLPPMNMSSYSVQAQPFVTPVSTNPATTVGGYDVNYLSNYMRMMGIQPPTTQQQWAYLLSSVQGVNPQSLFSPSSKAQSLMVPSSGPDLSHLFPTKTPDPYTDPSALVAQKASLMNILNSGQFPQPLASNGGVTSISVTGVDQSVGVVNQQLPQSKSSRGKSSKKSSTQDANALPQERANPVYHSSGEDEEENDPLAMSSIQVSSRHARNGSSKKPRPHSSTAMSLTRSSVYRDVTSRDEASVTRVHVPDYRAKEEEEEDSDKSSDIQMNNSVKGVVQTPRGVSVEVAFKDEEEEEEEEDGFQTVQFRHNARLSKLGGASLPAKVYAPMGYKPVVFSPKQS